MKTSQHFRKPVVILMALAMAALPLMAASNATYNAVPESNNYNYTQTPIQTPAPVAPASASKFSVPLSSASQDVLKLAQSGVSANVINSYVQNSPLAYGLTTDNIIALHTAGIEGDTIALMINHDKQLREQAALAASTAPQPPPDSAYATPPALQPLQQPVYNNYATTTVVPDYSDYGYYGGYPYNYSLGFYPWYGYSGGYFWPGRGWGRYPYRGGYYHGGYYHGGWGHSIGGGVHGNISHGGGGFGGGHGGFSGGHGGGFGGGHGGGHR